MKEFLTTGALVVGLTLFGTQSAGPVDETNIPPTIKHSTPEGFVPHQRVTMPPVLEHVPTKGLLPNYGSEAYL